MLWRGGLPKSRRPDRELNTPPFHTWALRRLRFMLTADHCDAWIRFGGLSAQLNNLSILLHLATVESIAVALAYDTILSTRLEELARSRANKTAGAVDFTDLLSTEQHRFKIHAIDLAAKTAPKPAVPRVVTKAVTEVTKAPTRRHWMPKKQYMAVLAAEKKAAEASDVASAATSSTDSPLRALSNRLRARSRSRSPRRIDYGPRNPAQPKRNQRRR